MNLLRGWLGEKKTTFRMWLSLDAKTYRRFHDIIIPSRNGTTQIDHLVVSQYGLFIVETKNHKGWIFGSEDQPKWTKVLYKKKYSFQNPLRQTYRQKKVLSEFLDLSDTVIYPIVYFVGDCHFKTRMPANVLRSRLARYIKGFRYEAIAPQEVERIVHVLEQHISGSSLKRRDHIRSLRQRHASDTICPRCGSRLVERTAKEGT